MTETVAHPIAGDPDFAAPEESIGWPTASYGVSVVDDAGQAVAPGQIGLLRIKGKRGVSHHATLDWLSRINAIVERATVSFAPWQAVSMTENLPPLTDLVLLERQILSQAPDASLPANLSNQWLKLIARDLETLVAQEAGDPQVAAGNLAAPLALVYRLLEGKGQTGESSIPMDVLQE